MKVIVLAAGEGTRLRPLTADRPKCLVELHGRTLLDRQLDALRRCGVADVVIVTGHRHEAFRGRPERLYHNPEYARTNMVHSLFCAEPELDGDVIVSYGDIVFEPRVAQALMAAPGALSVVVDTGWRDLWAARFSNPLTDAETLKIDGDGNIVEIGKKPRSYDEIHAQYIGLFKIAAPAVADVRRFYRGLDRSRRYDGKDVDNMYMTSLLDLIARDLLKVRAVPVAHGWLEVDSVDDLRLYSSWPPAGSALFSFAAS